MTNKLYDDIRQWKVELEGEREELKREYEDFEKSIELTNAKITIATEAKYIVRSTRREDFGKVIIGPLESESDSLYKRFEDFKDHYNVQLSYVNALIEQIHARLPIEE